jgi:cytochrome c-type biogenesis protein CcmH/NrfG
MPTKKQRRRQKKARRHEYEYVYVDDEGNEVAVDPAELRTEKTEERETRPKQAQRRKPEAPRTPRRGIEPPSWRRSGKRALILGPILIVAMMLFNQGLPLSQQVAPAIFLIAFFIPFSYFTDSLAYRMYRKRLERSKTAKGS